MINIQNPKKFILPTYGEIIKYQNIKYTIGGYINNGAFGSVYECSDEWGNRLVAKIIKPRNNKSYEQIKKEWLHELTNLVMLRHPNVTYIHNAFEYRDTFYIIVERCESTLSYLISQPKIIGDLWLPYIARDILHGLDYIHKNGYVHKDLHAGNIFVSKQYDSMVPDKEPVWSFKIGDLGISNIESKIRANNTNMAQWMLPPEYIKTNEFGEIGKLVDIYHVGLLLLNLLKNQQLNFTKKQIIEGEPKEMAKQLESPYAPAIYNALERYVSKRTQSAINMWQDIYNSMPKPIA